MTIFVEIYCYVEALENGGMFRKKCGIPFIPRVGDSIDGFTVKEVRYDTRLGRAIIHTENAPYAYGPEDGTFLRERLHCYDYTECSSDEWMQSRAINVP